MKKQLLITILLAFGIYFNSKSQAGAALNFNTANDRVLLPQAISTNSLVGGTKITVEAWVRPTTLTGLGGIVGDYGNPGNQMQFLLRRENNYYGFWVGNSVTSGYQSVSSPAASATLNTWQHVAGVYNGTVLTIYINGVFSASASITNYTFATSSNSFIVGYGNNGLEPFAGDIDELRVWNTNRNKCEINTFMNCEIPSNATNLIANYHFNQGIAASNNTTVTTLNDATSGAYNGTLQAFTLLTSTSNWITPGGVVSGFTTALAGPSYSASPSSACVGSSVSLTSTGATSFTWSTGVTNAVAFTPTAMTSYTLTNTNSVTACSNTIVAIVGNPIPTISVNSGTFCAGSSFTMVGSGASTYTFQGGNAVVSPTANTSYTVVGTSSAGCVSSTFATSNVTVVVCPSGLTQNQVETNGFNAYPNPFNNKITVISAGVKQTAQVVNVLGSVVYTSVIENEKIEIDLSQQPNGIYFIKLGSVTKKLIKE